MMPRKNDEFLGAVYPHFLGALRKYLRPFVASEKAAEDLAHAAFLQVYTAPNFVQIDSPRDYLYQIARDLAQNMTSLHLVGGTDTVVKVADSVEPQARSERRPMTGDEHNVLCVAISRLTERQSRVLTLRVIFDGSCENISKQLKISRTTVHRELASAVMAIHAARASIESERRALIESAFADRDTNVIDLFCE